MITSVVGYSAFLYWYMKNQHEKALEQSQTVGLILGQDIAKLILLNDISVASDITTKLKSFQTLKTMVLYKKDKTPIFQYSKEDKSFTVKPLINHPQKNKTLVENGILKLTIEALYQQTHLGYIQLDFEVESLFDLIRQSLGGILLVFAFMGVFSYFLAHFFATKFTDPILKLVKFLEQIDHLSFLEKRVYTKEDNEFGKLYDEINKMLQRIETSHQALKIASVAFETQSGMTITDKDQKILQVNHAFTKITGYSKKEAIGQTPAILKSGLHDKKFYENMYATLQKDHIWIGEVQNKHKSGNIVTEHLIIQAVLDEQNQPQYYVASFLDITKQKLIEAKLTKQDKILIQQSKMAQMGEMLENIAHQWRQPLSVITTTASGLKMQKEYGVLDQSNLDESLDNITISATHLSQTIEDFRNFYKDNKIKQKFFLNNSIEKALTLLKSKFKNQNIEVVQQIQDIEFEGYENELIQVFINILNNARDELVKKENEQRVILITLQNNGTTITISFQDNAGGIPQDILPKIFESHFTTKANDGTGIGLYMSKMIVENMDGVINASNTHFNHNQKSYFGAKFSIQFDLV
jgi:PAS domain S-box-containing protein